MGCGETVDLLSMYRWVTWTSSGNGETVGGRNDKQRYALIVGLFPSGFEETMVLEYCISGEFLRGNINLGVLAFWGGMDTRSAPGGALSYRMEPV